MTRRGTSPGRCCHRRTALSSSKYLLNARVQAAYETCSSLVDQWDDVQAAEDLKASEDAKKKAEEEAKEPS